MTQVSSASFFSLAGCGKQEAGPHRENDSLSGGNTKHARCDTLVERLGALVLEHVGGYFEEAREGCFAWFFGCLLDTSGGVSNGAIVTKPVDAHSPPVGHLATVA